MFAPARPTDPDTLQLLQQSAHDVRVRALPLGRLRTLQGADPPYARAAWAAFADLGWLGLRAPEPVGGLGLGADAAVVVCRELGRAAAPEPYVENALACVALLASATDAGEWLGPLVAGERTFTCPLAPDAWRTPAVRVTARTADGHCVLDGALAQLPLAPDADYLIVPVRDDDRLVACVVPRVCDGVRVSPLPLADGTRDGHVQFTAARAHPLALGDTDTTQRAATRALAQAGLGAAAYLTGLCHALLDMTLDYLRTRRQFGRPLGNFQALQHRAVDMYLHLRLTEAALRAASPCIDGPDGHLHAARVRARAGATTMLIVREAIQLHGAIGYTAPWDGSLYVQRALVVGARYGACWRELADDPALAPRASDARAALALPAPLGDGFQPPGGDWNTLDDAVFRSTVRDFVERHYPAALRHAPGQLRWAEIGDWHRRLVARGWAAPAWPVAHGGMGLAPGKMIIFIEELERFGVARAPDQGVVMIGPILMEYGTPEQRARFLPKALTGEHLWCQGYSEPNAGSDLASLATRAVADGDGFIVNGQKTWTTHGLDATHMYCLVRTDPQARPQAGISFLLIDLEQPGVTVRPIVNLGGHVDFCEVFLDDVRVPRENLVGPLNQGWTIAKSLLGHERLFVGSPKLCRHALHQLQELVVAIGRAEDPVTRDALARLTLDVQHLEALYEEYAAIVRQGGTPGADISILKIWSTETYVRLSELMLAQAGRAAGVYGRQSFGDAE
ncbi:MAG: acyl-CoA dehydrogenase, partial [Gammaproteobacteria bacterium]